jgi:hypothetical protein
MTVKTMCPPGARLSVTVLDEFGTSVCIQEIDETVGKNAVVLSDAVGLGRYRTVVNGYLEAG